MKKGILTSLGLAAVLTLGLASVNEYRDFKEVDAAGSYEKATSIAVGDTVLLVCESKTMELSGISTTSTKYGLGVAYTSSPVGKYPLTIVEGSSSGTYAFKNSDNQYLYWTSGNSLATNATLDANTSWSVTFDSGNAIIKNGKDSTRQLKWNASSPRFACYTSGQTAVQLYKSVESTDPEEPVDKTNEVNALFEDYYNYGTYTKETILNVNTDTMEEIKEYFHAGAKAKYRKTEYTPETLTMYTSDDGEYDTDLYSKYENAEENGTKYVKHSGTVGGNYNYYEKETIDDWFVTLPDFKTITTGWTDEDGDGVYTFELKEQPEMTTMAREFVAPMWLSTDAAKNYIIFDKLTVEKDGSDLVMKLYTVEGNSGNLEDQNNLVFAQATISYVPKVFTTIAEAKTAKEGAEISFTNVTVSEIYQAWDDYYKNISFYVTDGVDKILVFRTGTMAYVGDIVDVTGIITIYTPTNGTPQAQVKQGATVKIKTPHTCSYGKATCTTPASCEYCGAHKDEVTLPHDYVSGVCSSCGSEDPDYEGEVTYEAVETALALSFSSAANKASADTYLTTNFPNWVITGKLGQTYGGYLGFGRSGDAKSAITSGRFTATSEFTLTAVLKGNGDSNGNMTSTLTFELLDASGNVIATSDTITPVHNKDTTYTITFTYVSGKTYADAANLRISFAKATGNIGLKTLSAAY